MKKICVFIFLVILQLAVKGQDAVVSPVKNNVLYTGIINPVEIAVPGVAADKINATVNNGTIKRNGTEWEIHPEALGQCTVTVLAGNRKVADKIFRVKSLPVPIAVFADTFTGHITKHKATAQMSLEARLIDFDWDLKFNIESFSMLVRNQKGERDIPAEGNILTPEMRKELAALTSGESIIFKDIKAKGPDGKIRDLSPVILKMD